MGKNFTWSNFTKSFLKSVIYADQTGTHLKPKIIMEDKDFLIPFMDRIYPYPNERFVRLYRRQIEDSFLAGSNELMHVCKLLQKQHYGGIVTAGNDEMLCSLREKRLTQTLCDAYRNELIRCGKNLEEGESFFQVPKIIDLQHAASDVVSLYRYQQNAVKAMAEHFLTHNRPSGVLCMPTGSGKTRTSVYWLLHNMVSRGYQVIWLAHRSMLIEQAAEQFYQFAPIIKDTAPKKARFKMVCVSMKHASILMLRPDDALIVASVQSLCNKLTYLPNILKEKVIVVVDESHHTLAPSYQRIIRCIRTNRPDAKLLGLTATPVRANEKDTKSLMKLFDNTVVFSVAMADLIADGTLSKPIHTSLNTNVDIEAMIDLDERKYIEKWGEMPDSLLLKVAKTNKRNDIIVNQYIQNKALYGKTIIFALNAIHCDTLNEAFRAKGIRSGYVYTLNGNSENQRTIERFRHNEGPDGLDVLININILTEGSDIPDIQTVFLTRPTTSDVLLMQMVGRGMRGIGCGGTAAVNIVDFCDKWDSIQGWLNPQFTIGDAEAELPASKPRSSVSSLIPMQAIRDLVKGITYQGAAAGPASVTLPVGWYDVNDEDGNDEKVLVFENQLEGYRQLHAYAAQYAADHDATPKEVVFRFFRAFGPLPNEDDMTHILLYLRQENTFPTFQPFEVRDAIEPACLADKIKNENLNYLDMRQLIARTCQEHQDLIKSLYGDTTYYQQRITEYLVYENGMVPVGTRVEEVDKTHYVLSAQPCADSLDTLLDEVMREQKDHLGDAFVRPQIFWTDRAVGSYFGVFYHHYNMIQINALLNSANVPREVLKFLIYHECLHQEFHRHSPLFGRRNSCIRIFRIIIIFWMPISVTLIWKLPCNHVCRRRPMRLKTASNMVY